MKKRAKNNNLIIGILILISFGVLIYFLLIPKYKFVNIERKDIKTKEKYAINEVIPVYVDDENLAKRYLVDWVTTMISFPDRAYELLDDVTKSRFTLDSFKNYIRNKSNSNFYKMQVKGYTYQEENGKRDLYIVDGDDNNYIFRDISLMEYKVFIQ